MNILKTNPKNQLQFHQFFIGLFFLFTLLGCESKRNETVSITKKTVEADSVDFWITQASNRKLKVEKRERFLEKAYDFSKLLSNEKSQSSNFSKIAYETVNLGNASLFKKVNNDAMRLALKLQDTFKIGDAHWNYASYYSRKEVMDSAYFYYHKAYEQFKLLKDDYYTAKMLYNMGYIQGRIKDYTGSEISMFEAIAIFEKLKKYESLYQCYNYLGLIYYNLDEFDRAIFYHNKALDYLNKVENKMIYKEGSLSNLGLIYQKQKNYDAAIHKFEEALGNRNLKKIDINFYARLIDNIAYTKFLSGDTVNIKEDFLKALKIRDSIQNISGVVISKRHLSELYALKLDTLNAVKFANEAYSLADKVENNRDKLETLLLLSKVDKTKAITYLKEYVHVNDSLQIEERKTRNKFTRIRFETDEYIEETEKLTEQRILISIGAFFTILILSLIYFIRIQNARNKELIFEKEQQKSNEEIFSLMLKQQSKLEEGRMNERNRISQDLHDGVLGKIFGTRLGLGFLNVSGDEETIEKHKFYIDELQNIEKEIRTISHELKNEIVSSKENFSKIIEDLIEQKSILGKFKYEFICDSEINWDNVNDEIKINFYRITQEALQNILKYAKASFVLISIELVNNTTLNLNIKDDGLGFDVKEKRKGIGLKNMLSRANNLKGVFNVYSEVNKGTTIFVSCSLQKNENE